MRAGRALSLLHPTAGRRDVTRTVCDGRSSRESLAGARTKGIGARLGLDQGARLGFISAKLSYALAGRTRIAKLRTRESPPAVAPRCASRCQIASRASYGSDSASCCAPDRPRAAALTATPRKRKLRTKL